MSSRTFTNADDGQLIELIRTAGHCLILAAPGVSEAVADALDELISGPHRPERLAIILDIDPEVCRLGYGTLTGLKKVRNALEAQHLRLQQQTGLRLGLVLTQSRTLFYSPTPLLIEAGSTVANKPSGILVETATVPGVKAACGLGDTPNPELAQEVGLDFLSNAELTKVEMDLAENPPKEFDVARIERVFNYQLQFVEFKVTDYRLSSKNVHLQPEWLGLDDKDLTRRITNQFKLFDRGDVIEVAVPRLDDEGAIARGPDGRRLREMVGEKDLDRMAKQLRDYLVPVSDYGHVIAKKRKAGFEQDVAVFRKMVRFYGRNVRRDLRRKLQDIKKRLLDELTPGLVKKSPRIWLRSTLDGKLSAEQVRERLGKALDSVFVGVGDGFDPKVLVVYKDVTYSTIHDPDFKAKLDRFYGEDAVAELFDEHDAAREKWRERPDAQLQLSFGTGT
jgi:hypothetical protein